MFSIKLKIVFAYTIIFGIILTLFAFIIYNSTKRSDISKLDARLKSYAILLQSEIEEQSQENKKFNFLDIKSVPADGLKDARFQLLNGKGETVIGYSIIKSAQINLINIILKGRDRFANVKNNKFSDRIYYSALELNEKTDHILITSASMEEVEEDLQRLFFLFLIIIPLGLIMTGISAHLIAKKAFKPISEMIATANTISAYSLDKRLKVPAANDEVKALSITLNSMIDRLDKTFKSHRQFIADASHEIKTPLTVIQAELELSLRKTSDVQIIDSINTALIEIGNLSRLTISLLTLAKIDAAKNKLDVQRIRMDELIIECVQKLKGYADQHNNKINISIDEVSEINGDREKLKSVIINILDNALKYSGENKEVSIELKKENPGNINVIIKDNGCGIPGKDLPYIYERFYRSNETRASVEGNGLGLAIVKEFIEMHSGKITVESRVGEGTVFSVYLPVGEA